MVAEYVGVDLHRRRSVIVRLDQAGEMISEVRVANDPMVLAAEIGKAGSGARVVLEATYGLVLGGRFDPGDGYRRPSGPPARFELGEPAP